MSEDRELLAAALEPLWDEAERQTIADALLPVVDRIANQRAAAELETVADGIGDWPGVGNAIRSQLHERAAALRQPPSLDNELLASVLRKLLAVNGGVLAESVGGRSRVAMNGTVEVSPEELAAVDRAFLIEEKP